MRSAEHQPDDSRQGEGRSGLPANIVVSIPDAELESMETLESQNLLSGECHQSVAALGSGPLAGRVDIGIWEVTPGCFEDVEVDEMFVVLSGRATLEYLDDGTTFELMPGSLGFSRLGARTRWTIHETLRKGFQATFPDDEVG